MQNQGRYIWRHDSTINKIAKVNQRNARDHTILTINVDLVKKSWTIPPDLVTNARPCGDRQYHQVYLNT